MLEDTSMGLLAPPFKIARDEVVVAYRNLLLRLGACPHPNNCSDCEEARRGFINTVALKLKLDEETSKLAHSIRRVDPPEK